MIPNSTPRERSGPLNKIPYWRLSGFYFFYFAALGSLLPYWPLYLHNLGFDHGQIGALMAALVGAKIIAPNLWGWIADRSGRPLTVIRLGSLFTVLSFGLMYECSDFWPMLWASVIYSFFWNASLPSFEAITLHHLHGQSERYSRVRLWGSIGFIVSVLSIGWGLDSYPIADLPYAMALLLTGIWLVSLLVPQGAALRHQEAGASFARLLWRSEVLAFLAVSLLVQLAHGPYYVFFTVYLTHHGYSSGEAGQLWCLGVVAEVALFLFMARLLKRVSLRSLLLGSLVLSALRWWVTAQAVDQPWLLAAAQTLHAATFGATHVVAIHLVHHYFGGAHHAKGQAIYNSVAYGVGGMLGSYVAGALWVQWGGPAVFTGAAAVSLLAFTIAWLGINSANSRRLI